MHCHKLVNQDEHCQDHSHECDPSVLRQQTPFKRLEMLDYKADFNLRAKITDDFDRKRHAIVLGKRHHLYYDLACLRVKE